MACRNKVTMEPIVQLNHFSISLHDNSMIYITCRAKQFYHYFQIVDFDLDMTNLDKELVTVIAAKILMLKNRQCALNPYLQHLIKGNLSDEHFN